MKKGGRKRGEYRRGEMGREVEKAKETSPVPPQTPLTVNGKQISIPSLKSGVSDFAFWLYPLPGRRPQQPIHHLKPVCGLLFKRHVASNKFFFPLASPPV